MTPEPALAASSDFQLTPSDRHQLRHLRDLMHLLHHRNKNQHRRSHWWRHFSTFRRQLNAFVAEMDRLYEVPSTHLARVRKDARDREIRTGVERRVAFWRDVMVPKWQNAFSQLVADGRFAVLGLVGLAALAQTCRIVGVTEAIDEMAQAEVEKVLEEFGREQWGPSRDGTTHGDEDVGEVIARQTTGDDHDTTEGLDVPEASTSTTEPSNERAKRAKSTTTSTKPARKKRRKGNAIDDLFSGLD